MMTTPDQPSGAEEFVDAQLDLAEMSPTVEKTVHDTLEGKPGVAEVSVSDEKAIVLYDPTLITRNDLIHALEGAGVQIRHAEAHRESPITEIEDRVAPFLERGEPSSPRNKKHDG